MIEPLDTSLSKEIQNKYCKNKKTFYSFLIIILDISLIYLLFTFRENSFLSYGVAPFVLAIIYFHQFSILHDCGHGSFSKNDLLNTVVGHASSVLCYLPFYPWKTIHSEHHKWSGVLDKDPVLKNLSKWKEAGEAPALVNWAWITWIPLAGFLQHFVFWFYPLKLYKENKLNTKLLFQCSFSVLFFFMAQALIWIGLYLSSFILPVALSFLIYLVLVELVNLPHHNRLPFSTERQSFSQQYYSTRSCYFSKPISEICFLNFNFHIEHHLFPTAPWHTLRAIRDEVKPALNDQYHESIAFSWNLANRTKSFDEAMINNELKEECEYA